MRKKILFKYITTKILPVLLFFTMSCIILSELVGISFEQIRLISDGRISINTSILVHIFAAPKFISIAIPYALLMTNIFAYKELSRSSEIAALCSFGISVNRILKPSLIIAMLIAGFALGFQESVVVESNYKTATILETAMQIDRSSDVIHNFTYNQIDNTHQEKVIDLLLYATTASSKRMEDLVLIYFDRGNLQEIITARSADWRSQEKIWELNDGSDDKIDHNSYLVSNKFKTYKVRTKDTLTQILSQTRDDNELNILELERKLNIFRETGHQKEVRQLEKTIHEHFLAPFSCVVFSMIGASIGININPKSERNEMGLGLVVILLYYVLGFVSTALIGSETIPILGIWIPNLAGLLFAYLKIIKFS